MARSIHLGCGLRFPCNKLSVSLFALQNTLALQTSMLASYLPGMFSNCHCNVTLFFVQGDVQEVLIVWVHQDFLIFLWHQMNNNFIMSFKWRQVQCCVLQGTKGLLTPWIITLASGRKIGITHRALFNWVSKTKTKVITTANQSKGNYQREPMTTRSKRV